jgi:hypothetical protein
LTLLGSRSIGSSRICLALISSNHAALKPAPVRVPTLRSTPGVVK